MKIKRHKNGKNILKFYNVFNDDGFYCYSIALNPTSWTGRRKAYYGIYYLYFNPNYENGLFTDDQDWSGVLEINTMDQIKDLIIKVAKKEKFNIEF